MTISEWIRVLICAGVLTAFGTRLYGRPLAQIILFCFYTIVSIIYIYQLIIGHMIAQWIYK